MATITATFGQGGANLTPSGQGTPTLATALQEIADDLAALRTAHNALTSKLDADTGVTDTNYAALHTVAALKTIRG